MSQGRGRRPRAARSTAAGRPCARPSAPQLRASRVRDYATVGAALLWTLETRARQRIRRRPARCVDGSYGTLAAAMLARRTRRACRAARRGGLKSQHDRSRLGGARAEGAP
jgi:hypothetical protein